MRAWLGSRRQQPVPEGRPIEAIVADLRRLCRRYHALDPRTPFVKVEAVRGAYDKVLGECCAALGRTHLLDVLRDARELDAERERVEDLVRDSGVRLPYAA
jgi:hypothetical protein